MNGRCEKDALDRAEDICELCGNQFCAACLLYPRGQRNAPTCKGCALANSGLRGTGSANRPISRRDYKKRKKELLAQLEGVEEEAPALTYFDLNDPTEFDQSTELDRRAEAIEAAAPLDILTPEDDPAPAAPPPAVPPPPTGVADQAVPPPPSAPEVAAERALDGLGPVDTSVNPLAVGAPSTPPPSPPRDEAVSEASASAAELLARLKADQPIQSQFAPSQRSVDTDPFAIEPSSPGQTAPLEAPPSEQTLPPAEPLAPAQPVTAATIDHAAAGASPVGNPFVPAPAVPAPAPVAPQRPRAEPWTPPTPPPRGSNLDGMATPEVPAPAVAEIPEALLPPPPSPEASPAEEQTEQRKADTDHTGQWIPPSLRGMAPAEEREADPLPKRR